MGPLLAAVKAMALCVVLLVAASAEPSSSLGTWTAGCLEGGSGPKCGTPLDHASAFLAAQAYDPGGSASASELESACKSSCATSLISNLTATLTVWNTTPDITDTSCGATTSPSALTQLAGATYQFVCSTGESAASSRAGDCVRTIVSGLVSSSLWDAVKSMDPSLKFENNTLDAACTALVPAGCCFRMATLLLSALAQQLCLPSLANEYISLPGRCELLRNIQVPDACTTEWDAIVLPLLKPRTDCGVWGGSDGGRSTWLGTSCTQGQADGEDCPTSACGLWCGIQSRYQVQLAAAARSLSVGQGSRDGLATWIIVYISVVSAVVALLLLLVAVLVYSARRDGELALPWSRKTADPEPVRPRSAPGLGQDLPPPGSTGDGTSGTPAGGMSTGTVTAGLPSLGSSPLGHGLVLGEDRSSTGGFSVAGGTISMVGSITGNISLAHSVGVSSMAGRSGLTIRSLATAQGEADDRLAPLPAGSSLDAQTSPVHYANVLYGSALPNDSSPSASQCTTPAFAPQPSTPVGTTDSGGNAPPLRSSRSFSFGDELTRQAGGPGATPGMAGWSIRGSGSGRSPSSGGSRTAPSSGGNGNGSTPPPVAVPGPSGVVAWFGATGTAGRAAVSAATGGDTAVGPVSMPLPGQHGARLPPSPITLRIGRTAPPEREAPSEGASFVTATPEVPPSWSVRAPSSAASLYFSAASARLAGSSTTLGSQSQVFRTAVDDLGEIEGEGGGEGGRDGDGDGDGDREGAGLHSQPLTLGAAAAPEEPEQSQPLQPQSPLQAPHTLVVPVQPQLELEPGSPSPESVDLPQPPVHAQPGIQPQPESPR